jgi:hypothetical protein
LCRIRRPIATANRLNARLRGPVSTQSIGSARIAFDLDPEHALQASVRVEHNVRRAVSVRAKVARSEPVIGKFGAGASRGGSKPAAFLTTLCNAHHPWVVCFAPADAALLTKPRTLNAAAPSSARRAGSRDPRTICLAFEETAGPRTPGTLFSDLKGKGTAAMVAIGASTSAAETAAPLLGDTSLVSALEAVSSAGSEPNVFHALSRRSHAVDRASYRPS